MIFICGDNHGHFQHILEAVDKHRPQAVILLGDIEAQRPLEQELAPVLDLTELFWIHGNHDTDTQENFNHLWYSKLADRNLHGRVVEIEGIRVTGLGGIFRGKVWAPPEQPRYMTHEDFTGCVLENFSQNFATTAAVRHKMDRTHRSTIFPDIYEQVAVQKADLLVTHEAPDCHPHGFAAITELAQSLEVKAAFHGHHHDSLNYRPVWESLGFEAYGIGFCGITEHTGAIIVPGDMDEEGAYRSIKDPNLS